MINLAVINIKDLLRILRNIIFGFLFFFIIIKFFPLLKRFNLCNFSNDIEVKSIINDEVVLANYLNKDEKNVQKKEGLKKILVSEFAMFDEEEKLMELENQEEVLEFQNTDNIEEAVEDNSKIENELPNNLSTKIISQNNKNDVFTDVYKSVKIKNESSYELTEEILNPNVEFSNKKDIIIYHTHTCESYTPTENSSYISSGNYRTTDLNYSIVRVGTELENELKNKGFNVIHNINYHDYPAYSGSYTRSLATITSILSQNPNSELIIDLHRDALGNNSGYAPRVKIGDETVAQIMFVMGTDGGGLEHPNWINNFKCAIKIQEKANEMYPGLFKPIILRNSRYNQHISKAACIIEVGATGNTLEECLGSMKYLSKVLEEVMKE